MEDEERKNRRKMKLRWKKGRWSNMITNHNLVGRCLLSQPRLPIHSSHDTDNKNMKQQHHHVIIFITKALSHLRSVLCTFPFMHIYGNSLSIHNLKCHFWPLQSKVFISNPLLPPPCNPLVLCTGAVPGLWHNVCMLSPSQMTVVKRDTLQSVIQYLNPCAHDWRNTKSQAKNSKRGM